MKEECKNRLMPIKKRPHNHPDLNLIPFGERDRYIVPTLIKKPKSIEI